MNINVSTKPKALDGESAFKTLGDHAVTKQYNELLQILYGENNQPLIAWQSLKKGFYDPRKHYIFVVMDGQVVAAARAVLDDGGPIKTAFVSDVVVHKAYRREGYTALVCKRLCDQSFARWSSREPVRYVLFQEMDRDAAVSLQETGWQQQVTGTWEKTLGS